MNSGNAVQRTSRILLALAVLVGSITLGESPAAAATATVNGVVYTSGSDGTAYASGFTSDLPANLTIESSVVIGAETYSVTGIGSQAFMAASALVSVTIPDSVTSISGYAFYNAPKLVSVSIPDSVTSIALGAFYQAKALATVNIPNRLTLIGDQVFSQTNLASVVIPSSVTSIGDSAFSYNQNLKSVTIPDSVTRIGASAFQGVGLTSVVVPDSVTRLYDSTFSDDRSLASVTIGSGVTALGSYVFSDGQSNTALKSVIFKGRAPTVTAKTFYRATPKIYHYAKYGSAVVSGGFSSPTWQGLTTVSMSDPLALTPKPTLSGVAEVGQTLTANVGTWNDGVSFAYAWNRNGVAIMAATSATYLLTSADLEASITVTVTGSKTGFSSVSVSSDPKVVNLASMSLTPTPFLGGTSMVGETLRLYAGNWDEGVTLSYVWKRDGVAITGATSATYLLTKADLAAIITATVSGNKTGFRSVSMTTEPFPAVAAQTSVTLQGVIYKLDGDGAAYVYGYTGEMPTTVSIASSVTIDDLDYAVTSIAAYAFYYGPIVSLTIPDSVTSIGDYSFFANNSLGSVTLPESLKSIGSMAFAYTGITSITIPSSVTEIADYAFYWASSLTSVNFRGAAPSIVSRAFEGENPTVYFYSRFGSDVVADGFTTPTWLGLNAVAFSAPLTLTPTPVIAGTVAVGETITADLGVWDSGVSFEYRWLRNGNEIAGATSASYVMTADDLNALLTVTVTASKPGFDSLTKTSSATLPVAAGTLTLTPTPTISGSAIFGETLTANPGVWDSGVALSYVWKRDGVTIDGATSASYLLAVDDAGKKMSVTVTGSKKVYQSTSRTSVQTQFVALRTAVLPQKSYLRCLGAVNEKSCWAVYSQLRFPISVGGWDNKFESTIVWLRNGESTGQSGQTYKLTDLDVGAVITARVTAFMPGYNAFEITSQPSPAVIATELESSPASIAGQAAVGAVLQARAERKWDAALERAWQWLRDGVEITGATKANYEVSNSDLGCKISVRIYSSVREFESVKYTSAATEKVIVLKELEHGTNIDGDRFVGEDLAADTSAWTDGVDFTFQWHRDNHEIQNDGNTRFYKLLKKDAGSVVWVEVTGSKDGYLTETVIVGKKGKKVGQRQLNEKQLLDTELTYSKGGLTASKPWCKFKDAKFSYSWTLDGKAQTGKGATFSPSKSGLVEVTVLVKVDGFGDTTRTAIEKFTLKTDKAATSTTSNGKKR